MRGRDRRSSGELRQHSRRGSLRAPASAAAAFAAASIVAACGSTALPRAREPERTALRVFAAASRTGCQTIAISSKRNGECWEASTIVGGAWRCMTSNEIRDPCFSGLSGVVICPNGGPWAHTATELRLTRELPISPASERPATSGMPWALQLSDGTRCLFAQGATSTITGLRFNYTCNTARLWLYGSSDRKAAVWTIFGGRAHASQLRQYPMGAARVEGRCVRRVAEDSRTSVSNSTGFAEVLSVRWW